MSRTGSSWDNSAAESFFSSLKTERTAPANIFDYIERFYNPTLRDSTLGHQSPFAFEQQVQIV